MTIFGWDASSYDWDRGPMNLAAAVADGIVFMTHKATEGRSFVDPRYDDFARRARGVVPLLGAYCVNHPGDQRPQVDSYLRVLDSVSPWWRSGPFIVQLDAERWSYAAEPSLGEIRAWCDYFVSRTGGRHRPVVYAPRWVYGDRLRGLPYPLWQSAYGDDPAVHYRAAYPGDGSIRWAPYSGQVPAILQYGSQTRIGTQRTCDADAYRGTFAQLLALVYQGGEEPDVVTDDDVRRIAQGVWELFRAPVGPDGTAYNMQDHVLKTEFGVAGLRTQVQALAAEVQRLTALIESGGGNVDVAAILAGIDVRLTALRAAVEGDTRDAVADLGEGGAAKVRADQ